MTGAPLPDGADAVVMIERCTLLDGGRVRIDEGPVKPGLNVLPRGQDMRAGDGLLRVGTRLNSQTICPTGACPS